KRGISGYQLAVNATPIKLSWASINFIPNYSATAGSGLSAFWNPLTGCNGSPDPHGNCMLQDINETFLHGEWRDGGAAVAMNVPTWNIPYWNAWPTDYQTAVGSVPELIQQPFANQTPYQSSGINFTSYSPPFAGTWGRPWSNDAGTHPNPAGATALPNESIR